MNQILISFATRPAHGSEGGVGWAFVEGAATYARAHDAAVDVVLDSRDADSVSAALTHHPDGRFVRLQPVAIPGWAQRRYGDSRTRQSYLAWLPEARRLVRRLARDTEAEVIHQVTFATAVLPSALPTKSGARRLWGPINLPWAAISERGKLPSPRASATLRIARWSGLANARRADMVIATNDLTARYFQDESRDIIVEPNIFVTAALTRAQVDESLLSAVGLLNNRKRPWLALEAITHPALRTYHLQFIGDGPLRTDLEQYASSLGVADRVTFLGQLSHEDALRALGRSRVLLHPAVREGAAWVVGEAAALGVPAVVFSTAGAATAARLSENNSEIVAPTSDPAAALAEGVCTVLHRQRPTPSTRWDSARVPGLLERWWG